MIETPASFATSEDGRFWHISITKALWKTLAGGATPTFAAIVNGASDQFLSSSRFSKYQNVGRRRGNQINLFEDVSKRRASSDKSAKVFLYLTPKIVVFQLQFLAKMLNLLKSSGVRDRHGCLISEQTKPLKLVR